jgi:hypothetical protein
MADRNNPPKAGGNSPGGGIKKKEAVRRALQKLGNDAKPAQIQPYIKRTFGIDMTAAHITTAKGEILHGKGGQGKAAAPKEPPALQPQGQPAAASLATPKAAGDGKAKAQPAPTERPATAPASSPKAAPRAGGSGITLEDIAATQGLLQRVGADHLKQLIDLLAR